MVSDRVRADYPTLENIASTFDREQERIQQVQNALSQHVDLLRNGGWVSDAADTFYREMDDELLPSIGRLAAALGQAAETTRDIVGIFKAAEQEAATQLRLNDQPTIDSSTSGNGIAGSNGDKPPRRFREDGLFRRIILQEATEEPPNPLTGWQAEVYADAVALGVDPVLAMMLIQNEINNLGPDDHGWYDLLWGIGGRSFGISQVRTETGADMIELYPESFEEFAEAYPQIYNSDGTVNEYELGYWMYNDDTFSVRMATVYLQHNETLIYNDLASFGVVVSSEPIPGVATIRTGTTVGHCGI